MTDVFGWDEILSNIAEDIRNEVPSDDKEVQERRLKLLYEHYEGSDRIVTSEELEKLMEEEPEQKTISSGFPLLDKITGGFAYEQLIVITAQEKSGKTAFVLQLASGMPQEHPCCFLFEQSPREIIRQMKAKGQEIPYFVTPLSNVDNRWKWVQERALEAMVKKGSKVFVIDNVDWLQVDRRRDERSDETYKKLLIEIKSFCKQWGVTIFLVAHVTKMNFEDIPQPNNVKDTGAFKQIADTMLILWRKTREEKVTGTKTAALTRSNETLLWVAENRRTGQTGYVQLAFDGKKFIEKTWDAQLEGSMEASEAFANY